MKAACDCGAPSLTPGSYWRNACARCAALEAGEQEQGQGRRAIICGVPEDMATLRRWRRRRGLISMERAREVGDACEAWLRERGLIGEGAP